MKYLQAVVAVILLAESAFAQSRSGWGGAGWFHAGYGAVSGYKALRDAVTANGLSLPSSASAILIGGGGGAYLGRIFVGGSGETFLGGPVGGGSGSFQLGFFWRFGQKLLVLPTVGVGGAGYTFVVGNRPGEAEFSQAVGTGVTPKSLSTGGVVGNGGLALQYFSSKGLLLGLQAGYERALGEWRDWSSAGITLTNGPAVTPQRFYVRLLVGGGGISTSE